MPSRSTGHQQLYYSIQFLRRNRPVHSQWHSNPSHNIADHIRNSFLVLTEMAHSSCYTLLAF